MSKHSVEISRGKVTGGGECFSRRLNNIIWTTMLNYTVNMFDLLKEVVFSNWESSFWCSLELAFINCSVFNLYSAFWFPTKVIAKFRGLAKLKISLKLDNSLKGIPVALAWSRNPVSCEAWRNLNHMGYPNPFSERLSRQFCQNGNSTRLTVPYKIWLISVSCFMIFSVYVEQIIVKN